MTLNEAIMFLQDGIESVDEGLRIDEGRFITAGASTVIPDGLVGSFSIQEEDDSCERIGDKYLVTVYQIKD